MGPTDQEYGDERRRERVDAALRGGWVIRYDGGRDEFAAARGEVRARELDKLLDAIEAADGGR